MQRERGLSLDTEGEKNPGLTGGAGRGTEGRRARTRRTNFLDRVNTSWFALSIKHVFEFWCFDIWGLTDTGGIAFPGPANSWDK